ncbi:MAG: SGNH/GDSL hydrolase family protein [Oscillospiraceae bacterium]|nr:SGNH/GDSL hydrolase family protein [Oscillospiraceae bacterium]
MVLDISQIRAITCGAELVEQRPEGIWFQRMTHEQLEVYREPNPAFYNKALTTAGVMLSFSTDSASMTLDISIVKVMGRSYGTVEVFCNGAALENINNYSHMELPRDYAELSYPNIRKKVTYDLGDGKKHITIHFPRLTGVYLHELSLDDGASLQSVKPSKKALVFGDSITQGFDTLHPTVHHIHALCRALDAEEYNKGVGGERHAPLLAQCPESFTPDYIFVGYGTNDWRRTDPEFLERNCAELYRILAQKYPNVPVITVTPVWRAELDAYADVIRFESFHDVEACILRHTAAYPNVTVIRGFDLIPHDIMYFADYGLHPNDSGFTHYSKNLLAALRDKGFF